MSRDGSGKNLWSDLRISCPLLGVAESRGPARNMIFDTDLRGAAGYSFVLGFREKQPELGLHHIPVASYHPLVQVSTLGAKPCTLIPKLYVFKVDVHAALWV